jgi:hypothetical protein
MRTFYNGYRFSEDATESLYNPTLSLYFLKALEHQGQYPRRMLDENLAMDRNKLTYIAQLPGGEQLLIEALAGDDRVVVPELVACAIESIPRSTVSSRPCSGPRATAAC